MFGIKRFKTIKKQSQIVFKSRFLEKLSSMERYEFLQLCHRRKYKENEYIYYQGDPGTGMYLIEEGKVELIVNSEQTGDEQEQSRSYVIESPESFGALSLGYELRRVSSAKCLCNSTLLGFFKPDFETLRDRHPQIAVKFLETLATIAMRQLENTTKALIESDGAARAFQIQFETYYSNKATDE